MLGFYIPQTAKVIWRRDLGLKSHPKIFESEGHNQFAIGGNIVDIKIYIKHVLLFLM